MSDVTRGTAPLGGALTDFEILPAERIGAYRLLERLGRGGMGEVYRAVHEVTERVVALKVVDLDDHQLRHHLEQVTREAMAMASLRDANVVTCYSFGEDGRKLFLALELMAGGDTARMVQQRGQPCAEAEIRTFARACAKGLAAIHRIGLVHRDIKPSNILLDAAGNAKLGDFGLACFREVDGKEPSRTEVGTPAYMPPESITGVSAPDIRGDIYSLGVTMYYWATGVSPFRDVNGYSAMQRVISGGSPPIHAFNAGISDDLIAIIARMMQPDREHRFQDPQALLAALEGKEPTPPLVPLPATPRKEALPTHPRASTSRLLIWAGMAVVVMALAVFSLRSAPAATGSTVPAFGLPASAGGPAASALAGGYRLPWVGDGLVHFHENGAVSYTQAGQVIHLAEEGWLDGEAAPALTGLLASTGDFSVELALRPGNLSQEGPARIFSIGLTPRAADLMIGQSGSRIEVRVRTSATNPDGTRPNLISDDGVLDAAWHHLVFVRAGTHHALFVDGTLRMECDVPGDLSTWNPDFPLCVGNDHRGGFPWAGSVERLILGGRAWSAEEIQARYAGWQHTMIRVQAR
ncbi:MAG: protein kinase [Planctomycetes bacterium]|nr:protein kinase [Planctomycetota bacterium]